MCGLWGVAGYYISKDHWAAVEQLAYCSSVRGWDATGVATVSKEKDEIRWEVAKTVNSTMHLWNHKDYKDIYNRHFDLRAVIGHCRAATVGKNEPKNAHPFEFEHLVGAHNGTLIRRARNQHKYETDSEALFADINERGVEVVIPDVSGAWALTWYDGFQNTLNFLRNDQRDLYIAVLKHTDTIFWASESGLLEWVLNRMHFEIDTIVKLKPDLHVKWKLFEPKWLDTVETAEVKGAAPQTFFRETGEGNKQLPFVPAKKDESPPSSTNSSQKSAKVVSIESRERRPAARIKFRKGWQGEQYSDQEYRTLLETGCQFCGAIEAANKPHRWIARDKYLCSECKDDWQFAGCMVN